MFILVFFGFKDMFGYTTRNISTVENISFFSGSMKCGYKFSLFFALDIFQSQRSLETSEGFILILEKIELASSSTHLSDTKRLDMFFLLT